MSAYINNYVFDTNKDIDRDINILLVSDIHLTYNKTFDNLFKIKDALGNRFKNIDYILIPGDIVDKVCELLIEDNIKQFNLILKDFIENKKTYVVLGNHDLFIDNTDSFKYFKQIFKGIKNVTILESGKIVKDNKISFMGIVPDYSYYSDKSNSNLIYNEIINNDVKDKFIKDTFNIVLTHSPSSIINLSKMNNKSIIDNVDLVVSGHMHSGITPVMLQKILKGRGIIGPYKKLFLKYCYGLFKVNDTNFIVNGAVNTYINNKFINDLFSPKASVIKIRKKY